MHTPTTRAPSLLHLWGRKLAAVSQTIIFFFFFLFTLDEEEDARCQPGRHFHAEQEHADLLLLSNYFCPNCSGFITA